MLLTAAHGRVADISDACRADLFCLGFAAESLPDADLKLLRLLDRFDLRLEVDRVGTPPIWLALAVDLGEVAIGKGWRAADAVRRCLGEIAECRSWIARGDEPVRYGASDQDLSSTLTPEALLGLAPGTIGDRGLAWVEVAALGDALIALAPAALCYGRAPAAWSAGSGLVADTNGCAAGPDVLSAQLAALLEVIERDAAGIWWYAACRRPELVLSERVEPRLAAVAATRTGDRHRWFLDLTHDLGVPVVAAVSLDVERGLPAIGLGAALDVRRAVEKAYFEMVQAEVNLSLCQARWRARQDEELSCDDFRLREWLLLATPDRLTWLRPEGRSEVAEAATMSAAVARSACISALHASRLHAWCLDLTRSDIGVPVVKVVVPGACHCKPRLGFDRLVQVPFELGWKRSIAKKSGLQKLPLLA